MVVLYSCASLLLSPVLASGLFPDWTVLLFCSAVLYDTYDKSLPKQSASLFLKYHSCMSSYENTAWIFRCPGSQNTVLVAGIVSNVAWICFLYFTPLNLFCKSLFHNVSTCFLSLVSTSALWNLASVLALVANIARGYFCLEELFWGLLNWPSLFQQLHGSVGVFHCYDIFTCTSPSSRK